MEAWAWECQGEFTYDNWYQSKFLESLKKPLKHWKAILKANDLEITSTKHNGKWWILKQKGSTRLKRKRRRT